jgi:hypothetical protein
MKGQATTESGAETSDFARVAEHVAPHLFRMAVRMYGRPDEPEGLVQDALLQGFRRWSQFEGRSDPAIRRSAVLATSSVTTRAVVETESEDVCALRQIANSGPQISG